MPHHSSSKPSSGKKTIVGLAVLGLFLISGAVYLVWFSPFLELSTLVVDQGSSKISVKGLSALQNQKMLFLDPHEIEHNIYSNNPWVESVNVTKKYPSTIEIKLSFYRPIVFLEVSEGYFKLSRDGRILEKIKKINDDLPVIHFYQKLSYTAYKSGDKVDYKEIIASIQFAEKAKDLGLKINSVDIRSFSMIALKTEDREIFFSVEKKQEDQLYQFEKVVQELKIKGKSFKTLDLRFDRIIIGD